MWIAKKVSLNKTVECVGDRSVKTFKYLGSLVTNQNFIQDEIKCRLKAGNSCYYSVQTLCLLDFCLRI